jgi:biotin carboxyl carrier protein
VFQVDGPGSSVVDPTGRRASLEADEPPRARLTTSGDGQAGQAGTQAGTHAGTHAVLLTPLPDVRRAAAGVQRVEVVVDGWRFEVDVESEARARLRERATSARASTGKGGPSELRAIIPGRVVSVDVAEGDLVEAGGRLLVLEAMKMQNEVRAPRAGTVARLAVGAGQTVELGDVLLVIE